MIRRLPVIPTLVVLIAVAIMLRLGFWQLDRLAEKEVLLTRFEAAAVNPAIVAWPSGPYHARDRQAMDFRQTAFTCVEVLKTEAISGRNAQGEAGWAHLARCKTDQGYNRAEVILGWSRQPNSPVWAGGPVKGTFRLSGRFDARVVADPPLAGLEANAHPDPRDIPNNHFAYAVQWFLFALVALVIYGLAVRKRLRE